MTDEIRLTLPRERPFYGIAHLVLGGLAVRLDLTFETLEDLQLALENVLGETRAGGDLTVSIRIDGNVLHASVGPFDAEELARFAAGTPEGVTLARVLDAVVDAVKIGERDGASFVDVTKTVRRAAA